MTSDDDTPNKKSLNPLEDMELDDDNDPIDEDIEDVEEIIDASPLGSELDNESYAGGDDADFEAELSAMPDDGDDIDTDVDSTPSFDTERARGRGKKRGGMKKMLAPALVLVIAAGAAGYIVMNPAILGGGDTGPLSGNATTSATNDFEAEAEALRQAQSRTAGNKEGNQEDSGIGGMGGDLPQPLPNTASATANDNDNATLSPDKTIEDIMNVGDEMNETLDEPESTSEATASAESGSEFENGLPREVSVELPEMDEAESAAVETAERSVNETPEPKNNETPRELQNMTAEPVEPVEPVEEEPVIEQGRGNGVAAAATDENDIFERDYRNIVGQDNDNSSGAGNTQIAQADSSQDDGDDSFYDSEMRVPQGQVSGPRKLDPRVEPATSLVVATQDYKADDQESLVVAANRALKLRRYDAALDMFKSLYGKNKRDRRILMGLAVAQQNTGRVESAIQSYEELLEIDPDNADAMVNMLGLIKEQYPSVALRRLLDLQSRHSSHAGLAAQIGITQADMGQYQEAMRYLGKAASLDPRNPQHLFNLAIVADRQGKTKEAIGFYEQALEVDTVYASGRALPRETIYDRLSKLRRR